MLQLSLAAVESFSSVPVRVGAVPFLIENIHADSAEHFGTKLNIHPLLYEFIFFFLPTLLVSIYDLIYR